MLYFSYFSIFLTTYSPHLPSSSLTNKISIQPALAACTDVMRA